MDRERVIVSVPATSANLGPGFDCLGIALDVFSYIKAERSSVFSISATGEGADLLATTKDNIVYAAMEKVFRKAGRSIPTLKIGIDNRIPLRRGLGSSASAVTGGLVAANSLIGSPLSIEELLDIGTQMEGHPDNVTPALVGGCTVSVIENNAIVYTKIPIPDGLELVLFIPDFDMATKATRVILPTQVSRGDAVYNIGRTALLVAAFATGRTDILNIATQDRLHQPARKKLFPQMDQIFAAAIEAGAAGVFLSGAGSSIMSLAFNSSQAIADAMKGEAMRSGVSGSTLVTRPSLIGASFEET